MHPQDQLDPLAHYRERFCFPQHHGGDVVYFCGNSLGLQPRSVEQYLAEELSAWKKYGVEGHFEGERPWKSYHHFFKEKEARLVGALPEEVVVMNTLTTNLHLMMVSFYRPEGKKRKILMEAGAFPSDQYAVESQIRFHGYDYEDAVVEISPRSDEQTLRTEDILAAIADHADELALVLFAGVNYYTGQYFDLEAICRQSQQFGIPVGLDLAHAAGNLPLRLHDWGCDFAVWCTYKYLNSGPGGPGGVFVHQRHADRPDLPRFAGWWGYDETTRFQMRRGFKPMHGADGWQLSNAQIMAMAPHLASLEIFDEVGMDALRAKSLALTGYLIESLQAIHARKPRFAILTPMDPQARGAQISMLMDDGIGRPIFEGLLQAGIIGDWREPNVIRIAPAPLYNSFADVARFVEVFDRLLPG
jgi:kynureninase